LDHLDQLDQARISASGSYWAAWTSIGPIGPRDVPVFAHRSGPAVRGFHRDRASRTGCSRLGRVL